MNKKQTPETLVLAFLKALENRDMISAKALLAPNVTITFPGTAPFTQLDDLLPFARQRYQWIKKQIEGVDTVNPGQGEMVVYVRGCLYGLNLHNVEFSDVRFIDRFVVKDGLIVSHEVWNDLAESDVLQ